MMSYLLQRKGNQEKRFLNNKYKAEDTSNIELNWCNDANIIVAPLKTVRIPRSTCKKIINPKIITGLIRLIILFLKTTYIEIK